MKRVIYKQTGEVDKDTKRMKILMHRSRERNKNIIIGNAPVEVTDSEYDALKKGKHGADIVLVTGKTKLSAPMEHIVGGVARGNIFETCKCNHAQGEACNVCKIKMKQPKTIVDKVKKLIKVKRKK